MAWSEPYRLGINDLIPSIIVDLKDDMHIFTPTLPMNFDRSLIPQDICEREFLDMTKCMNSTMKVTDGQKLCSAWTLRFSECRIKRDIILYDRIKNWEIQKFKALSPQNKQLYMQGLTFKLERLKEELESTPSLASTELIENKIGHEEAQIRWRMRYLEKFK